MKLVRALLVESRREKTKRQEEVLQQDHQEVVRAQAPATHQGVDSAFATQRRAHSLLAACARPLCAEEHGLLRSIRVNQAGEGRSFSFYA